MPRKQIPKVEEAILDPARFFATPEEIADSPDLSREDKIRLLRSWEYDARELDVAEEEAMLGDGESFLQRTLNALLRLGADPHPELSAPTKQGGS